MPETEFRVLAFDFGLRHIGTAIGQSVTGTASPVATLRANDGEPDWQAVADLLAQWQPQRLVVGLPLNMDDTESEMSERARGFARALAERSGLEVELVDERLTSFAVRDVAREQKQGSHELAAVLIAQTYLQQVRQAARR